MPKSSHRSLAHAFIAIVAAIVVAGILFACCGGMGMLVWRSNQPEPNREAAPALSPAPREAKSPGRGEQVEGAPMRGGGRELFTPGVVGGQGSESRELRTPVNK